VRRPALENVSAISLSERLPTSHGSVLLGGLPGQGNSVYCHRADSHASKLLQGCKTGGLTRLSRDRVGKRLLNFIAELYTSQTRIPFYILASNPQIIRGNIRNWRATCFGHASMGRSNTRINNEIHGSLSRNRVTVSLQYCGPSFLRHPSSIF
jgi:hypothetical protein